jgi:hypothetical protein
VIGVPARPAAYIREAAATEADDPGLADQRGMVISLVQDLGWPVPAVYADAGQPGSQLAALGEAITAGRHDAVFATHPVIIGEDLAQIEAFDRLCRQHGVRPRFHWGGGLRDPRMLFVATRPDPAATCLARDGLPRAHPLPKTASGATLPPASHNHT